MKTNKAGVGRSDDQMTGTRMCLRETLDKFNGEWGFTGITCVIFCHNVVTFANTRTKVSRIIHRET